MTEQFRKLMSWPTGDLLERYVSASRGQQYDWRVSLVVDKSPLDIRLKDCIAAPNFFAPGIEFRNSFATVTEALRVSDHYCRTVEHVRTEKGTWGCWRWTNRAGSDVCQLCVPWGVDEASESINLNLNRKGESIGQEPLDAACKDICDVIEATAREVNVALGRHRKEQDYECELASRLRARGCNVVQQLDCSGRIADLLVDGVVFVEAKKNRVWYIELRWRNYVQAYRYCLLGNQAVCLLINFGNPEVEVLKVRATDLVSMVDY